MNKALSTLILATFWAFIACSDNSSSANDESLQGGNSPSQNAVNIPDNAVHCKLNDDPAASEFTMTCKSDYSYCRYENGSFEWISDSGTFNRTYSYEFIDDGLKLHDKNPDSWDDPLLIGGPSHSLYGFWEEASPLSDDNSRAFDIRQDSVIWYYKPTYDSATFDFMESCYIAGIYKVLASKSGNTNIENAPNIGGLFTVCQGSLFEQALTNSELIHELGIQVLSRSRFEISFILNEKNFTIKISNPVMKSSFDEFVDIEIKTPDKTCSLHHDSQSTPQKFCSAEYADKISIDGDEAYMYQDSNQPEFNECLKSL